MEIITPVFSKSQDIPDQLVYRLPKKFGAGGLTLENLSSGLMLAYMNVNLVQPVKLMSETIDWNFGVSFNLNGYSEVHSSGCWQIAAKPGVSAHYAYPGLQRIVEEIGVGHKFKIAVLFDSYTLQDLAAGDEEPFLPFLQGYKSKTSVAGLEKMDVETKRVLHELVSCPYSGKTRALYIESKAMEIFARRLEQIRIKGTSYGYRTRLGATDSEKIHYAANLLLLDLINPPNITELAKKVGMSRSRFYQNFKSVLGHSPMDYLRTHRLQLAKQLLRQGSYNVSEVAFATGFTNLSYFTRAFTAEFGVSPRQIR